MMNLLFLITKSQLGGAQTWTKEQIEICNKYFKCFLATDKNGWLSQNVVVQDKLLDKSIYKRLSFNYLLKLNRFIKNNEIDLIIASSANAGIYARLVKILNKKVKVIYVSHGWSSIYNGGKLTFLYTFIEKQLSKLSDSILCISKQDFINASEVIKIKKSKLNHITNKIFGLSKMSIKELDTGKKIKVLTVARLSPPKRVDLLVEATKNLKDTELHIVGDGELRVSLEKISHNNVFFHGEINSFDKFYEYDIIALISDYEGLGLSVVEGMSIGMPVIVSDVGSTYELVDENGILVKNDIKSIKKAISKCINNYEVYSKNSIKLFNKRFDLEKNKYLYLDYYKKVIDE